MNEVENKLGRLTHLQELSRATEEKLIALNGLAERVSQKTKVLEGQKHIVDRAVIQANHMNELAWNMDVQIGKLNEGLKEAARGEETAGRIEKLVEDIHEPVGTATRVRDELVHETARMEKDGRALMEMVHTNVETLALEKREFEAFSERLRALQDALQESEQRMDALGVKERQLSTLPQRIDEFSRSFEVLLGQADELTGKQASLDRLREGLTHVDDLTARTVAQYQSLTRSRADLEGLRKEIHDFQRSYADIAQLRDKLGADRTALEAFGERLGSFRARAPEIEATMDSILGKMSLVDEGTKQAARIGEMTADLDAQVTRVTGRLEVVGALQERLNALHAVASEVDSKLAEQLARRVELDTLRTHCDGLIAQMVDAQQKVEGVAALQGKVLPMETRLTILQDRLEKTGARVKEVQLDETTLADQEARFTDLVEQSRSLATETADRMQQAQGLAAQVARTSASRDELIEELARVQARQRDAVGQAEAAEDQLRRAETMYVALEQRRSQLAFSEKKLATVEIRMAELGKKSTDIELKMKALDDRDAVVAAVRSEVDNIHQISAKSLEDLQYVSDHREQVAALRRQVDELLATAGGAQRAIDAIDARRRDIEEVQSKTTLITNLLEDVRVNLETVGEQKAVVDHIIDRLAKLEFVTVEAQNTLRMLSQERELAERIEQSIKQLRGRAGANPEEGRQSAYSAFHDCVALP